MTVGVSNALLTQGLQRFVTAIAGGQLIAYSSPRPAKGILFGSFVELARFQLGNPAGTITNGQFLLAAVPNAIGVAQGIPTWCRWIASDSSFVMDCDVPADIAFTYGSQGRVEVGSTVTISNLQVGQATSNAMAFAVTEANAVASISLTVAAASATLGTLSGTTTGTTGVAQLFSVTLNGPVPAAGVVFTLSAPGATLSVPSLAFTFGGVTSKTFTVTRATDGTSSVSMTSSMTVAGSPKSYTSTTAAAGSMGAFTLTSTVPGPLPFAIGYPIRQGDVPAGSSITLSGATARARIMNTWPDGSAKFALIAGVYPGGTANITPVVGAVTEGAALTGASVQTAMGTNTAVFGCATFGTVTYSGADFATPFMTHASCDYFGEFIYRKPVGTDAHLVAWIAVRLWVGGAVEVLPWLENGYVSVPGAINKSAIYTFTLGGTSRFSALIDLPSHCRTPLVSGALLSHWLGTDPGVRPSHDKAYFQATRLVPTYLATVLPTAAAVVGQPSTYTPLQQGAYPTGMGGPGYHASIGLLPEWDALYLTSTASATMWAAIQRNAYSAGRYGIHNRDENTKRPIKFSDYPNMVLGDGTGVRSVGASSTNSRTVSSTGTIPADFASTHAPSMGFMSYLVTGRFYHLETMQFVSSVLFLKNNNTTRLFSQGIFDTMTGSNTVRGVGWSLRSLAQTAAMTPASDILYPEYIACLTNNVNWYHAKYVAQPNNPQGWVAVYVDYTLPEFGTTEANSTATTIVFHVGQVYESPANRYVGYKITIGGQERTIVTNDVLARTATVDVPFTVSTATKPWMMTWENILLEASWQQDFVTQAMGYMLAMPSNVGAAALTKMHDLFHWKAQSVVGRFGTTAPTDYLYRDAAPYNIAVAPDNFPDFDGGTGPWYNNWGEVWRDTTAMIVIIDGVVQPPKVDGPLRGYGSGPPTSQTGYWANLLPAMAYSVEHGVAGADVAFAKWKADASWTTFSSNCNVDCVWGIIPSTATVVTPPLPSVPANVIASPFGLNMVVTWNAAANAITYAVYRSTTNGVQGSALSGALTGLTFTDTTAVPGTNYFYGVIATNATGSSALSAQDPGMVPVTPPAAPPIPSNVTAISGASTIVVAWAVSATANNYTVFRSTVSGTLGTQLGGPTTALTATDTSPVPGTTYFYSVKATNAGGTSAASTQASAMVPVISVPGTLAARTISTNTQQSINPCPANNCIWSGGGTGGPRESFRVWCGGIYAPEIRSFIMAAAGGHASYDGNETYLFNIDTGKWSVRGIPSPYNGSAVVLTGPLSGEYPDGNPPARHNYGLISYMPPAWGGGALGSVLLFGMSGANVAQRIHIMDLATGLWRRFSEITTQFGSSYGCVARDDIRQGWWVVPSQCSFITFITKTGVYVPQHPFTNTNSQGQSMCCSVESLDIIVQAQGAVNWTLGTTFNQYMYLERAHPERGWHIINSARTQGDYRWGCEYDALTHTIVAYEGTGGRDLYRMHIPAVLSDPWPWTVEQVGGEVPFYGSGNPNGHWRRLSATPIGLVWVEDGDKVQVFE